MAEEAQATADATPVEKLEEAQATAATGARCKWYELVDEPEEKSSNTTTKRPNRQPRKMQLLRLRQALKDEHENCGTNPVNGGRLGLMREIRPEDTGKGPDNDGRHLGPNEGWTGGWSKPNAPCTR